MELTMGESLGVLSAFLGFYILFEKIIFCIFFPKNSFLYFISKKIVFYIF